MAMEAVRGTLERRLGWQVLAIEPVAGGDLNDAYRVRLPDGPRFVKSSPAAGAGVFADEAAGLLWLAEAEAAGGAGADGGAGGAAVARIAAVHDPDGELDAGEARLLALEWIEPGGLTPGVAAEFGRRLARTHAAGAPAFGAVPQLAGRGTAAPAIVLGHRPSRLGTVELPNEPAPTFAGFYAERRIAPLMRMARDAGTLSADDIAALELMLEALPERCGPPEPPARCHGDLWTGNLLPGADGVVRLIDPAAHGGHREADLAALRLFGRPPRELYDGYAEVAPLADGHEERIGLFQLGIVLLHVVLFGGGYAAAARRIADRYA